ncbi:MAG: hypothetical protein KKF27_20390 [Gammaproteobacteria bacterium]|nr:hypothetical protein [Gammaproteobacteria bacterium]MBU2685607.1 hypothetical protein [Gammaproteobacteria bacterium]
MKEVFKNATEALEACFDLWLSLAVSSSKDKEESLIWEENGGWLAYCTAECPCCEYTKSKNYNCNKCPIKWQGNYCENDNSPYRKWWLSETNLERTKYALEICILSLEAIKRLQK